MADSMGRVTARRIPALGLLPEIAASLQQPSGKVHGTWRAMFQGAQSNEFTIEIHGDRLATPKTVCLHTPARRGRFGSSNSVPLTWNQ